MHPATYPRTPSSNQGSTGCTSPETNAWKSQFFAQPPTILSHPASGSTGCTTHVTNAWESSRNAPPPVHTCLPGNRVTATVPEGRCRWLVATVMQRLYTPGLTTTTTTPSPPIRICTPPLPPMLRGGLSLGNRTPGAPGGRLCAGWGMTRGWWCGGMEWVGDETRVVRAVVQPTAGEAAAHVLRL